MQAKKVAFPATVAERVGDVAVALLALEVACWTTPWFVVVSTPVNSSSCQIPVSVPEPQLIVTAPVNDEPDARQTVQSTLPLETSSTLVQVRDPPVTDVGATGAPPESAAPTVRRSSEPVWVVTDAVFEDAPAAVVKLAVRVETDMDIGVSPRA